MRARGGLLLLAVLGCRDATQPFRPDDFGPRSDTAAIRLTYSLKPDHAPTWSTDGDTIYYTAESFPGLGLNTGGALLAVPRRGGTARLILPGEQIGAAQPLWLTTPALHTNGEQIAFFELTVVPPANCASVTCSVNVDTAGTQSEATAGRLRVVQMSSGHELGSLSIRFRGRVADQTRPTPFTVETIVFDALPFQRRFSEYRLPVFRPSWEPGGSRLVFSDGTRLLTWQPGDAQAVTIPNTDDGVWPSWSPDRQWIAYTRLPKGDPVTVPCSCSNSGGFIQEVQERTLYPNSLDPGVLTLIRPDGSGKREFGEGEAPSWIPGPPAGPTEVIVRRGGLLWRFNTENGAAAAIPNTTGANTPAVSGDGSYLAFARQNGKRDWDIWVVQLRVQ